jgi:hypothetical protein
VPHSVKRPSSRSKPAVYRHFYDAATLVLVSWWSREKWRIYTLYFTKKTARPGADPLNISDFLEAATRGFLRSTNTTCHPRLMWIMYAWPTSQTVYFLRKVDILYPTCSFERLKGSDVMNEASSACDGTYADTQRPASPRRASTSLVLEFLGLTLADGPVAVTDIEAKARAAGLLGPYQKVTGAKLFRRAKKSLGIRSRRVGFGAAGDWFWELPAPPCSRVPERSEEPAAKGVPPKAIYVERRPNVEPSCAEGSADVRFPPVQLPGSKAGGISRIYDVGDVTIWIEGVATLNPNRPAAGTPLLRWRQFIDDCKAFLDPAKGLAERALQLGWYTLDLFGCPPSQPLAHLGIAGLLWSINGGRVIELHRGWAMVEQANNGSRRTFDKRRHRQANLTLPWWIR